MEQLKPIIIAANGIADNTSGTVCGTQGFLDAIRHAVDPQNPNRVMNFIYVDDVAKHLPVTKKAHVLASCPRLERVGFRMRPMSLSDPCFLREIEHEPVDGVYFDDDCAIAMAHTLRMSKIDSKENLVKLRKKALIVAVGGSAMALGFGSLKYAKKAPATRSSWQRFKHNLDWYGRGVIKAAIIAHLPEHYPRWLVRLSFPYEPVHFLDDGTFMVIP